jgi:type III secretion system low calcium response chaperone LcrH/SycD
MKGDEKQVKQAAEKLGSDLKATESEAYAQIVKKATEGAVSPKDVLRISDGQMESIYAQAYRFYNTGKYKEASELFRYLMMVNSSETKYTLGLAACFHLMKDYKAAAQTYLMCNILDEKSPIPAFHASDCYLQMNDKVSALVSLNMAIDKAGSKPEYKILKDRAELTAQNLKKELKLNDTELEQLNKASVKALEG